MKQDSYLFSVDGGGTKTVFCAYNLQDLSKKYFFSGCTNYKSIDEKIAFKNLVDGFLNTCNELNINISQIKGCVFGLSGCDSKKDYLIYDKLIDEIGLSKEQRYICHDSEMAFYSIGQAPGIVVISGTGSVALGIDASGNKIRTGGWGSNISDLGSGYWIGCQAVQQLLLFCDGCGEYKEIFEKIKDQHDIKDYDILPMVFTGMSNYEIAAVARIAVEFAENGDDYSIDLVDKAVEHLSILINSIYGRLKFNEEESIDIVMAGSLFKNSFFRERFEEKIKSKYDFKNVKFTSIVSNPVDGGINIGIEKYLKKSF